MSVNTCKKCSSKLIEGSKFCSTCGAQISKRAEDEKKSVLNRVIIFYVTTIIFIVVSAYVNDHFYESFLAELFIEIAFALMIMLFSLDDHKELLKLYKFPKPSASAILITTVVPIVTAFSVSFVVGYINDLIDPTYNNNYYTDHLYLQNPLLWSIIFVAILPPIFEELAFRGYLYNQLRKITSGNITIIATAFLFALVHFSFISLLWIFPFGLFLGYLRKKYNTIWYGMIVHFIHNFIVLMIDYYMYFSIL